MCVQDAGDFEVAECDLNTAKQRCFCKGFNHVGICSHVIAVNHVLGEIDLNDILKSLGSAKNKKGKGGNRKHKLPALQREKPQDRLAYSDSSDEEEDQPLSLRMKKKQQKSS